MNKKTKLSKYLNLSINIIVLVVSYFYIVYLFQKKSIDFSIPSSTYEHLSTIAIFAITLFLLFLTFVNWFFESIKWKVLINKIQVISYKTAFISVLIGLFSSVFMPNRSGEWIGRIFSIKSEKKEALFIHTMLGNVIQYSITFFFGILSFVYYLDINTLIIKQLLLTINDFYFSMILLLLMLLISVIFFVLSRKYRWMLKLRKNITESIIQIKKFSFKKILFLIVLSIGRYLIFTLQYIILFRAFQISIPNFDIFMLIALYFLLLSLIPTVVFSEIGVRGSISLLLFGAYCNFFSLEISNIEPIVVFISTIIWLFNIIIPSIFGSFFMFRFKLFKK